VEEVVEAACNEWTEVCNPKSIAKLGAVGEREDEVWMDAMGNEGASPSGFSSADTSGAVSFLEQILGGFGRWLSSLTQLASKEAGKHLSFGAVAKEAGKMTTWYVAQYRWASSKNLQNKYTQIRRDAVKIYVQVELVLSKVQTKGRLAADKKEGFGMLFTAFVLLAIAALEVILRLVGFLVGKLIPEESAADRAAGWFILGVGNGVTWGTFAYISLGKYF